MTLDRQPTRAPDASASDYAYSALRQAITEGHLAPGRRLREIELSDWLGVSRTPVRQALSRLEVEGLIAAEPRSGLVVARLDDAAMAELYDMRTALEGTAAGLAATNANPREIAALQELVETEAGLPAADDQLFQHNVAFHRALYDAAHNRFLVKSLSALNDAMALLGPTTLVLPGRRETARKEHHAIVAAIADRDAAAAEAAARGHIASAFNARRHLARSGAAM
jgi:DNA-binding GntR family transcriptional regulator